MSNIPAPPTLANARLRRLHVPPFEALDASLPAGAVTDPATQQAVQAIVAAVRAEGDAAVGRYQVEFDGYAAGPGEWEVPAAACRAALSRIDPAVRQALEHAADRIRAYHAEQRQHGFELAYADGTRLGSRVLPLGSVGLYVPGGTAAYPSSVLMNALPAVVAGVETIVAVTPPHAATDTVLAACALAGVTRLFRVGGAQACAALAWGTATVPRVDKIVGPGNRWVAEAKRQLCGVVGIDMIAGPSEVVVVADEFAPPEWVAADLIAQAEHDPDACAWVVSPSVDLLDAVDAALVGQLQTAPRGAVAAAALRAHGLAVLTPDLATAVAVANRRAPEHLELLVREPRQWLDAITRAGAVFVGSHTPEAVGDYVAGPSHVLPTGGTARFASPLGVYDFVRHMSVIEYSPARLAADADAVIALAEAEGLPGHAEAIRVRRP